MFKLFKIAFKVSCLAVVAAVGFCAVQLWRMDSLERRDALMQVGEQFDRAHAFVNRLTGRMENLPALPEAPAAAAQPAVEEDFTEETIEELFRELSEAADRVGTQVGSRVSSHMGTTFASAKDR
jgi:hypothetical protein